MKTEKRLFESLVKEKFCLFITLIAIVLVEKNCSKKREELKTQRKYLIAN